MEFDAENGQIAAETVTRVSDPRWIRGRLLSWNVWLGAHMGFKLGVCLNQASISSHSHFPSCEERQNAQCQQARGENPLGPAAFSQVGGVSPTLRWVKVVCGLQLHPTKEAARHPRPLLAVVGRFQLRRPTPRCSQMVSSASISVQPFL